MNNNSGYFKTYLCPQFQFLSMNYEVYLSMLTCSVYVYFYICLIFDIYIIKNHKEVERL